MTRSILKKHKKVADAGNGATHVYAGHVLNVEVAAGISITLSKKKGEIRTFQLPTTGEAHIAAMIGLASSAMVMDKKVHVEFADAGGAESKVIAMRLGPKSETKSSLAKVETGADQATQSA
jgi:hypothetical protein